MQAVGFDGDVRKQEDAARVLAATVVHFGKLDILVNGAAGNFLASPEDLTPKGFRTGTSSNCVLVCIQIQWSSLLQLFPIVSDTPSVWFETLAFHPSSKTGFALLPSRKVVSLVYHYKTGVTR